MLREKLAELEKKLLAEVKAFYGPRLVSFVVFGSWGRGTGRPDSDFDFLLIIEDLPQGRMRRVAEFMEVETKIDPSLASLARQGIQTYLSPVLKTPLEAEAGSPLFLDMVEDARLLFDRNGFFARVLTRLRHRLKELGASRVWRGDSWYWVLKPDYQPGEEFNL